MRKHFAKMGAGALGGVVALLMISGGTAEAATFCHDPALGGTFRCAAPSEPSTGEAVWSFPNGTQEIFVIGTDNAVWTIWDNTSGGWSAWVSMKGQVISGEIAADFHTSSGDLQVAGGTWTPDLVVVGTNGGFFHNQRADGASGTWGGWKAGE